MSVESTSIDPPKMTFNRLYALLATPGAPRSVIAAPPVHRRGLKVESDTVLAQKQTPWYYSLDRALDILVKWSGSLWMFILLTASVLGWAFSGVVLGGNTTWQVFISDYQALLTYFFDSLLMRQQLRDFDHHLGDYATIRSRLHTHARLLERHVGTEPGRVIVNDDTTMSTFPTEPRALRVLTRVSNYIGHLVFVGVFWIGIVVWLAFGHSLGWSNAWQLYCNSATSALMVLLFAFLALVREEHCKYVQDCFDAIGEMDMRLEDELRRVTVDTTPNPSITITVGSTGRVQRVIDYYAGLISMLVGIMILTAVIIIWISLGPTMEFGDNWWLLIGTYAGLIGMTDGFVLRNTDEQLLSTEKEQWGLITQMEETILTRCNLDKDGGETSKRPLTTTNRISNAVNRICAHRYAVVGGLMVALTLVSAASALKWSFTGQLLCNVPPSIVESFFMIILISGHNHRNARKVEWCERVYKRRVVILEYVLESVKQ